MEIITLYDHIRKHIFMPKSTFSIGKILITIAQRERES